MGYFAELQNRPVQWPYEEVAIVDRKYVYQQVVVIMLESAKNMFAKFDLKVKGTNGVKYFKGKSKSNKKVIYTLEGEPIVNIADSKSGKKVYLGKTEQKCIAKVYAKDKRKFKIKFTNLATGQPAFFEMKTDKKFRICGIFYGKEKEGAPLVCKFTRDQYGKGRCGIEMGPGVDNMFLIALAHFFNNKADYKKLLKLAAVAAVGAGAVGAAAAGVAAAAAHKSKKHDKVYKSHGHTNIYYVGDAGYDSDDSHTSVSSSDSDSSISSYSNNDSDSNDSDSSEPSIDIDDNDYSDNDYDVGDDYDDGGDFDCDFDGDDD